jgi:hypothetical protein
MCERVADKQRMLYRGVTMNFAPQSGVSVVPAGPPPSTLEEPLPDIGKRELACLDLAGNLRFPDRQRLAWADFRETVRLWRLPVTLAWLDIKTRYRGSVLGPFWLTLSTGVMVAALGVLYARLFQMNLREYLPFIALSLVLWGFLQSLVNDGCICFTLEENMIRSIRMPFSFYAMRCVLRNFAVAFGCFRSNPIVRAYLCTLPRRSANYKQSPSDRILYNAYYLETGTDRTQDGLVAAQSLLCLGRDCPCPIA